MHTHDPSRRRFLARAVTATAIATLALDATSAPAAPAAAKLPKLPPDNAQAKALSYTEDATKVKHPSFKAGSRCDNCNFFKGAKGDASGPCQIFPQFSVSSQGWCSAWAKKA
ncbi:high-potential iron-sulfur protein [Lysobacter sp. 2RAF19]